MKVRIDIPENLSEITLAQYQEWIKIADDKELDTFLQQKMVEIFCKITLRQVSVLKVSEIPKIINELSNSFSEEPKFIDRFKHNGQEFGFIPKLDDMTFGEFVDLDNYLNDWQLMHKAMSVLFRPVTFEKNGEYLIEKYETADKHNLKEMPLDVVFGAVVFFWSLRNELQKSIMNYLTTQNQVIIPQEIKDLIKNGDGIAQFMDLQKETFFNLKTSLN